MKTKGLDIERDQGSDAKKNTKAKTCLSLDNNCKYFCIKDVGI